MLPLRSLLLILTGCLTAWSTASTSRAQVDLPPLIGHWAMEAGGKLADTGAGNIKGSAKGVEIVPGQVGQAFRFNDKSEVRATDKGALDRTFGQLTLTAWVKLDAYPTGENGAGLIAKREMNTQAPFVLSVGQDGQLGFEGFDGKNWNNKFSGVKKIPLVKWVHVAVTYRAGEKIRLYLKGEWVGGGDAPRPLAANDQPLVFGRDPFRGVFTGEMDEVRLYAAALTPEQLRADMAGTLAVRAATDADFAKPTHVVTLTLGRFDQPQGATIGYGRTRAMARRQAGPDAVDWPALTWKGKRLFEKDAQTQLDLPLREDDAAMSLFQRADDEVIEPGNHWFRPLQWLWGQRFAYTNDRTARGADNDYELWLFPVNIRGAGEADVRDVVLTAGGEEVYRQPGPWRSLTLLLPQNAPGKPYELAVAGRGPVRFDAGLKPIVPGAPKDEPFPVDAVIPGPGAVVTVRNLERPGTFVAQKEWDADLRGVAARAEAARGAAADAPALMPVNATATDAVSPSAPSPAPETLTLTGYLGVEVPRSPVTVNAVGLCHGMSGGSFFYNSPHSPAFLNRGSKFAGTVENFADYLADNGFDRVFEDAGSGALDDVNGARSRTRMTRALARRGVQFGLVPDTTSKRPFAAHANLAFYAWNLPDYHAPMLRTFQLAAQSLGQERGFAGFSIGADNAGYVPYWDWAPPHPNRPWAEAYLNWTGGQGDIPVGRSVGGRATTREFVDYLARYDETFGAYGSFERAVREVDPRMVVTTGSFGSSPGGGGRGGWPWASIPGREMHTGLQVQQAYDWDETRASKPMHNVALIDRLRSYFPEKTTWTIIDDFFLKFGREARQRAFALALTRGVQAVGTEFLAPPSGKHARLQTLADQRELHEWVHRYGGVYAATNPDALIGVLYVHPQALLRKVVAKYSLSAEDYKGSHEGKTTEALFMCHAAGWPARIITPDELRRGLPAGMRAVLLTGLNVFDDTWRWSDADGIEPALEKFSAAGGRVLLDDESVAPAALNAVATGMRIGAYTPQGEGGTDRPSLDKTPALIERNRGNLGRLREAMRGVAAPVAASADPTLWAVPHTTGDVQYVTVVNQASEPKRNATEFVTPRTGALAWQTDRPIYDVRAARRLAPAEAATVDLTRDGFQLYALPPAEVAAPTVAVRPAGPDGFFAAEVTVGQRAIRGVPVQVTVSKGSETATVFGASGSTIPLPVAARDAGDYRVTATELLTNQASPVASLTVPSAAASVSVHPPTPPELVRFAARRDAPLTVALTPAQADDPATQRLAARLTAFFTRAGRKVSAGRVEPNGIVLGLQPFQGMQKYPHWRTTDTDLVLLGSPADNVLILDQARGHLLPAPGGEKTAALRVTYSPFVGDRQALNLLATDADGLARAVAQVEAAGR